MGTLHSGLKLRRIDEHYRFALDFFWEKGEEFFQSIKYAANDDKCKIFRVGFVGFGEYAYEFLKVLCCLGQLPKCRLIIYVFDKKANEKKDKFQQELLDNSAKPYEKVFNSVYEENAGQRTVKESTDLDNFKYHDYPFYEIHFVKSDVEKNDFLDNCLIKEKIESLTDENEQKITSFTHMFFMLGNDALNINVATKVSTLYARNNIEAQFYVMVRNDDTMAQLKRVNGTFKTIYNSIDFIGANSDRYALDTTEENELEELGNNVHICYKFNNAFADVCKDIDLKLEDGKLNEVIKKGYNSIKKELINELSKHPFETFIKDEKQFKKTLFWFICNGTSEELIGELERLNINPLFRSTELSQISGAIISARADWKKYLDKIFDLPEHKADYHRKEYYRRSSKSRALFEKMLCRLGYLQYDEKNDHVKPRNVVQEYGVDDNAFKLKTIGKNPNAFVDPAYSPKNIASYILKDRVKNLDIDIKTAYDKIIAVTEVEEEQEKKRRENPNYDKQYKKITPHIDTQWFEVNNILQKRWMVFRWSEGFEKSSGNQENEKDLQAKTHKFLIPYIEIYANEEMRMRHTVYVLINGMAAQYASKYQVIERQNSNQ